MRVNDTVPATGTTFDWDIAEILERESIDVRLEFAYGDPSLDDYWEERLNDKRMDRHYDDVVESIKRWGFIRPLTAREGKDGMLHFGDGHHRLAAAIDLGMTFVPVKVCRSQKHGYDSELVARDSGSWSLRDEETRQKSQN